MISKREDEVTTAGVDIQRDGPVMGLAVHPLQPPTEDMATQLAHMARDQNTWEGARAALLRAMQLMREWERDQRESDRQRQPGEQSQ